MADDSDQGFSEAAVSQAQLDMVKQHLNFEPKGPPDQEWLSIPEIPTPEELNPNWSDKEEAEKARRLLKNEVHLPWEDKNLYLETHYRLQREESITMLRYSVRKFRENPHMGDDDETCVYTRVFVKGYLMTRLGPICRVRFSIERAGKRIRWNQTRRLTTGSLVVLSTAQDCFRTICMPAVIADHPIRDGLDQNPPTIQFYWANMDDAVMDPATELVMLESKGGYFESTRHTMVGLQHVAATTTPLDKYLVQADKSDLAAGFVAKEPTMNLTSLVHHVPDATTMDKDEVLLKLRTIRASLCQYPVLEGIDDGISQYTNLDNSQLEAVHRILTKELAIIQGPPGTGKTFTSVQAIRILLQSQERGSNVVVVAAQTNHAVDQILMQLIAHGQDVVRLGGRTQNEEMKHYSMYNTRRRAMPRSIQKSDRDYKTFEGARKKNVGRLQSIINEVFPSNVLDPGQLLNAGIITQAQYQSLISDAEWASAVESELADSTMAQWLGPTQLMKAPPMDYKDPIFTTDEDIEERGIRAETVDAEDYDIELDDCVADDDADRGIIRGTYVPIAHSWTGAKAEGLTESDFRLRKEMKKANLWEVNPKFRGMVYRTWQARLLELRVAEFRRILADSKRITNNLKINRWYKDAQIIKSARLEVIGCTTTGLTKYRGLLAALQPRTLLIEEAAETREANIISALYPSLQQLILVGDHQQLVPHCDTPGLSDYPYNMCVSLFERLVKLDMPFTMLNMQRRMKPTLRKVLNGFYPNLQDHPVVTKPEARPPIPGMATESFLFHHTWNEGVDEDLSKYNVLEAEMIVGLIRYLRMNGIHDSQISVLTFYRGQRKKILAEARKKLFAAQPFTNVHTVDSYQGEENDIIILSLVRSNGTSGLPQAGFVADQNRGVVSISRARRGFYVFGNMVNLLEAGDESRQMWEKVYNVFKEQGRFGEYGRLPLTCKTHGRILEVSHPEDWVVNHGGCDLPCEENLPCGHPCGRRCHPMEHDRLVCLVPCERVLHCGHHCQQVCGRPCSCQCPAYTGAYPNDDINQDGLFDSSDQNSHNAVGRARALAGTPFLPRAPRVNHHSRQARFPGARTGIIQGGSRHNGNGMANGLASTLQQGAPPMGYANWNAYNARRDDAEALRRRQVQQRPKSPDLIDLHDKPRAVSDEGDAPVVRETFRQVTLTTSGKRTVRDGVVSSSSEASSPGKRSRAQRGMMPSGRSRSVTGIPSQPAVRLNHRSAKSVSSGLPHRFTPKLGPCPDATPAFPHPSGPHKNQEMTSTGDRTVATQAEKPPLPSSQNPSTSATSLANGTDGANSPTQRTGRNDVEIPVHGSHNHATVQSREPARETSPYVTGSVVWSAPGAPDFAIRAYENYTARTTRHPFIPADPRQHQEQLEAFSDLEYLRYLDSSREVDGTDWDTEFPNPGDSEKPTAGKGGAGDSETLLDL